MLRIQKNKVSYVKRAWSIKMQKKTCYIANSLNKKIIWVHIRFLHGFHESSPPHPIPANVNRAVNVSTFDSCDNKVLHYMFVCLGLTALSAQIGYIAPQQ